MASDTPRETSSEQHAQAVRFLVSLQASKKNSQQQQDRQQQEQEDEAAQRDFLRSKGLDEAAIDRAYADARLPEHLNSSVAAGAKSTSDTATEAFDRAKRQFEAPLDPSPSSPSEEALGTEPQLPPKTYPRSPLALYQNQQQSTARLYAFQQQQQQQLSGPTTRYEVLLAFFRSFSYFLMLGGGFAAVLVGLYRAYMLPRLVSTLDSRSELLKHHHDLFGKLYSKVKKLRSSSSFIQPSASLDSEDDSPTSSPRRGVLKRVQFADEVGNDDGTTTTTSADKFASTNSSPAEETEDKKEAGDVVLPGTDIVVAAAKGSANDEKSKRHEVGNEEDGEKNPLLHKETGEDEETDEAKIVPIDVTAPLRSSLAKLVEALKADVSSQALLPPSSNITVSQTTPTVADEEESDDDDDDDELEFDPFAPPKTASSKKKHTTISSPAASLTTTTTSRSDTMHSKATSLRSSLSAINANINAQTYTATASQYGARSFNSFGGSISSSFGGAASAGSGKNGADSNKAVDVAQIRADIRNLKGLLLSRRNFPIYSRPAPASAAT